MTLHVIRMPIVSRIPPTHLLIQPIQPVRRRRHVRHLLGRDVMRDEVRDRVADEHVGALDVVPEVLPDVVLRGAGDGDEVAPDLDVGAVEDGAVGRGFFDEGDEAWHLRIIDLVVHG